MAAGRKRGTPLSLSLIHSLSLSLSLLHFLSSLCFCLALSLLFSPRRTEEKIVRKYADTKHGEPIRARFARQKRFPRSLGFDRDPPVHLDALVRGECTGIRARVLRIYSNASFPGYLGNFWIRADALCSLRFTRSRLFRHVRSLFFFFYLFFLFFFFSLFHLVWIFIS